MQYEIKIQGYIQEHWFEELTVSHLEDSTTSIKGEFIDQASLYGVLRRIRDLGINLISVNQKA